MIRILGATGRLFEAAAVVPTVEQRIIFNGSIERKFDVARSLKENPNGLLFLKRSLNAERYGLFENEVIEYIGNISTEKVKRILSDVLVNGYYDFSNLEYQQEEEMKKIKLDNGLSKPYSSAITYALGFGMINNPIDRNNSYLSTEDEWKFLGDLNESHREVFDLKHTSDTDVNTIIFSEENEVFYDDTEVDGWESWADEM